MEVVAGQTQAYCISLYSIDLETKTVVISLYFLFVSKAFNTAYL